VVTHSRTRATDTNHGGVRLTPEDQLILLLARGTLPPQVRRRALALLATELNCDLILERAIVEEVYPLLYGNLRKLPAPGSMLQAPCYARAGSDEEGPVTGPRSVLEQLGKLAKINAFRNALLTEELVRVLKLLSESGIPAIPLKGVALAQALYGDPGMRTCVDIDILVPRSMVGRAFSLLRAEGYKSEFGAGFFANLLLRHDIEYALRRNDRGFEFMVELHWGVLWGGKLEESVTDQLWADARPATVFGAPAYALSAEWQILFLAAHAARHQWQGLKWLVDLHELYSAPDINWDKLTRKAKQLGWEELLRISFLACHSLFETPIPEKYLVGQLPAWVKLFPESASPMLNGAFFATRLMKSATEKVRYTARVLFVPTLAEYRLLRLPSFLGLLYYAFRPLRLICKWTGAALRGFAAPALRGQRSEVGGQRPDIPDSRDQRPALSRVEGSEVSFELEVRSRTSEIRELRSNS
jgi:hypothetical protein